MSEENALPEPKWVRKGKCQRCGRCCSQVVTTMPFVEELRGYLEWLSLHQGVTVRLDTKANIAEIDIRAKCRMLRFKKDKAVCKMYDNRPKICQDFPVNPTGTGGRGCPGFTFSLEPQNDPTPPTK